MRYTASGEKVTTSHDKASGNKLYPDGQDYGNFHYGAISIAMGFSRFISDLGADVYSLWKNQTLKNEDKQIHLGKNM